jgi:hypothetical protein
MRLLGIGPCAVAAMLIAEIILLVQRKIGCALGVALAALPVHIHVQDGCS